DWTGDRRSGRRGAGDVAAASLASRAAPASRASRPRSASGRRVEALPGRVRAVSGADLLPSIVGIVLVAAAAAFVLLPFARGAQLEVAPAVTPDSDTPDRLALYHQVLELEFDQQLGKLSAEDFQQLSAELLAEAG